MKYCMWRSFLWHSSFMSFAYKFSIRQESILKWFVTKYLSFIVYIYYTYILIIHNTKKEKRSYSNKFICTKTWRMKFNEGNVWILKMKSGFNTTAYLFWEKSLLISYKGSSSLLWRHIPFITCWHEFSNAESMRKSMASSVSFTRSSNCWSRILVLLLIYSRLWATWGPAPPPYYRMLTYAGLTPGMWGIRPWVSSGRFRVVP